jgi:hypothetical protein
LHFAGIDLHKKAITIHVVHQARQKLDHQRLPCFADAID